MADTLESLRQALKGRAWDGVIVRFCIRGRFEFAEQLSRLLGCWMLNGGSSSGRDRG